MNNSNFTYLKSGVDIQKTTKLVKFISKLSKSTKIKGSEIKNFKNIGGFGSVFDLGQYKIKDPLIVTSTDGVGTKLEIANHLNDFRTIGIDLVAMCVNDLIVQGAKPLLFLDYISINKIDLTNIKQLLLQCHDKVDIYIDDMNTINSRFKNLNFKLGYKF